MEKYLNVFQRRIDDLTKISISERKDKGDGVLFLDFCKENELNCYYLTLNEKTFPDNLRKNIVDRMEVAPKSMIYFFIYDDKNNERIIEVDLDKNSKFHEKTNHKFENIVN